MESDRHPCTHCGEPVARVARKCRHCGEYLASDAPAIEPRAGAVLSFALGLTLVALLCVVLSVGAAIVGPNVLRVRHEVNERAAVNHLKALVSAQLAYQSQDLDGDGARDFGTLGELAQAGQLEPDLASGLVDHYLFEVGVSMTDPEARWMATATPMGASRGGGRHFATNHTGAIYFRHSPFRLDLTDCEFPSDALPLGALGQLR